MERDAYLQSLFYLSSRVPSKGALPPGSLHNIYVYAIYVIYVDITVDIIEASYYNSTKACASQNRLTAYFVSNTCFIDALSTLFVKVSIAAYCLEACKYVVHCYNSYY